MKLSLWSTQDSLTMDTKICKKIRGNAIVFLFDQKPQKEWNVGLTVEEFLQGLISDFFDFALGNFQNHSDFCQRKFFMIVQGHHQSFLFGKKINTFSDVGLPACPDLGRNFLVLRQSRGLVHGNLRFSEVVLSSWWQSPTYSALRPGRCALVFGIHSSLHG